MHQCVALGIHNKKHYVRISWLDSKCWMLYGRTTETSVAWQAQQQLVLLLERRMEFGVMHVGIFPVFDSYMMSDVSCVCVTLAMREEPRCDPLQFQKILVSHETDLHSRIFYTFFQSTLRIRDGPFLKYLIPVKAPRNQC